MNKNYVFNSNKKLLHVYICCARPNGRTVRHMINVNKYSNIPLHYLPVLTFQQFSYLSLQESSTKEDNVMLKLYIIQIRALIT